MAFRIFIRRHKMVYTVEEPDFPVEEGKHVGELTDIIESESDYGRCTRFIYRITDSGVGNGAIVSGVCNARVLAPGTRFYEWLSVLNGSNLDIGERVDPERFIGRKVEFFVKNIEKDGRKFSNVEKLLRLADPMF